MNNHSGTGEDESPRDEPELGRLQMQATSNHGRCEMLSILKKLTLATAAAGMLMLGPISVGDNTAKADGWRNGRGWNNGYYRRGIPGDGWRARYRSYYGPRYYGGYYQPYYGNYYYGPGYSYVPWTSIYSVPGYGVNTPYFGVQVW